MTAVFAAGQVARLGLGPDGGDAFRFTWWTTPIGARVWVEDRGSWRAGVVVRRGRKYVEVELAGAARQRRQVRKPYSELRRWR